MIKDIFKSNAKIEEYLCSPFLKQRNSFLNKMKKRGCGQRSLQMASEYLLFAIKTLNLSESDTSIVSLHRINASGAQRTDKNRFFYESTTINWLRDMGMIDPNFYDESIIFNKLSSRCHYRLRYHTYPLYHERISYLEYLSDSGAAFTTVRDHAIAQLYIIDLLNLKQGSIVRQIQIDDIVKRAKEGTLDAQFKVSRRWIKTFSSTANRWLRYSNILLEEKPYHIPGSDYVSQYLYWADNSKGLKRSTLDTRACELLRFTAYLNDKNQNIENIALTDIDGYICYRKSCGCARRTLATIITTLRDFLRYAYTQGWCSDLHIGLKTPKLFTMETLPMSPSWDDVKRLAGYYGTLDARGKRNSAIISMMAIYGMRSSEIAELHLSDIDWDKGLIYLNRAKRGGLQSFPLVGEVGNLIADYIVNGRHNEQKRNRLFLTLMMPYKNISKNCIYNIVSQAYKALCIEVKHIGGHSLRHACASHLINNGSSLKEVSDLLGHKRFDTTRIYAKIDLDNLRKVADTELGGVL